MKKIFLVLLAILSLISCKKEDSELQFATIRGDVSSIDFEAAGGSRTIEMLSNLDNWTLQTVYYTEAEGWVDVFDHQGSRDGRFVIKVKPNIDEPYLKEADINVVSGGKIYRTIHLRQNGVSPYIALDMNGIDNFSISNTGSMLSVRLKTNVSFTAQIGDNPSWIHVVEKTSNRIDFQIDHTNQNGERGAKVSFVMVGTGYEGVSTTINITQRGNETDINNATTSTIAAVLSHLNGGLGTINENVIVNAKVISDRKTLNNDPRSMWVQDESGCGLWIKFDVADKNIYNINSDLKLHLTGCSVIIDPETGGHRLDGVSDEVFVSAAASSQGATPIVLENLSQIDNYENCLVTLKNVQFEIPMGTYVNIDEANYLSIGNAASLPFADTPKEFGHIIRDKTGNNIKLYSSYLFTDRFSKIIPSGSGNLTAIVVKKKQYNDLNQMVGAVKTTLRIRSNSDNAVNSDSQTRLTKDIIRFGPFADNGNYSSLIPLVGTGSLYTSMFKDITTASGSTSMYWAWSYARKTTATLDGSGNGLPEMTGSSDMQYTSANQQAWWNGTGSSIIKEGTNLGEAWILKTSTLGVTGKLRLNFTNASSQTGPRYFVIEWGTSEAGNLASFTPVGTFEARDWNNNYQLLEYSFALPDNLKGLSEVVIRLRVRQNGEARATTTIATGGTNRIGYIAITEDK